jgi:hypothetical protein
MKYSWAIIHANMEWVSNILENVRSLFHTEKTIVVRISFQKTNLKAEGLGHSWSSIIAQATITS